MPVLLGYIISLSSGRTQGRGRGRARNWGGACRWPPALRATECVLFAPPGRFFRDTFNPLTRPHQPARTNRTRHTTPGSQLGSCPVRPAKSRNPRSSSGCKKKYYLSQTLLLRTESSPDLFKSVQPPKCAAHADTWVSDAHQWCMPVDFA